MRGTMRLPLQCGPGARHRARHDFRDTGSRARCTLSHPCHRQVPPACGRRKHANAPAAHRLCRATAPQKQFSLDCLPVSSRPEPAADCCMSLPLQRSLNSDTHKRACMLKNCILLPWQRTFASTMACRIDPYAPMSSGSLRGPACSSRTGLTGPCFQNSH
jgi:hypothetical protein